MLWLLTFAALVVVWLLVRASGHRHATPLPARPLPTELQGGGDFALAIVGEASYQRALERVCGGRTAEGEERLMPAVLICEDANPYDDHAVRIDIAGRTVGYLSRDKARRYRVRLAELGLDTSPTACPAMIVGGWDRGGGDTGHYGVRLDVRLAKSRRRP